MALKWVLFFVMQALLQTALGKATDPACFRNVGVIGGNKIQIGSAPYMAALFWDDLYQCGGSIIHNWFILTSAFCCMSYISEVHLGISKLNRRGTVISVNQTLMHEGFNVRTFENDICLLKLSDRVQVRRYVAKVDLAHDQYHINSGVIVNITGWGRSKRNGNVPDTLHQVAVPVVSDRCCPQTSHDKPDSVFCAGSYGHNFCNGDYGSPLTYHNVQVGIASIGGRGNCGEEPAFYTKIPSFYSWINKTIKNNI